MKPQHTTSYPFTLDDIIPHLRKARITKHTHPRKAIACCPAHDDNNPSLSLSETPDGKLLWNCRAGCSQQAVYEKLKELVGIKPATAKLILPRKKQSSKKQSASAEPLTLEMLAEEKQIPAEKLYDWHFREVPDKDTGKKIAIHYLTREKSVAKIQHRFGKNAESRFKWASGGKFILYGLWRISEWGTTDTVYLVEGTSDCITLWNVDLPALGIPSATIWNPDWWKELEEFQRIVMIPDTDNAGSGLVKLLAKTQPEQFRERVYVLRLPSDVKDVNELWIRENADPERFKQALDSCEIVLLEDTPEYQNRNTNDSTVSESEPDDEDGEPLMDVPLEETQPRRYKLVLAQTREREVAHAIVPNLLYAERITILAGEAGVGKTTFALEIADGLTRTGKLWNGTVEVQPARILWLDFDHRWNRLQEILDTYYGEAHREIYTMEPVEQPETQQSPTKEPKSPLPPPLSWETLADYRSAIEENGIDLIVADTAFEWLDIQDGNDETEARVKLQLIRELIAGTGCGVLLLHHPRKTVGEGGRTTALAGSHRFAAKVDVVAFLVPVNRDGMDVVKLIVAKDRDGEHREMELQRVSRKFIPLQRSAVPTGEWGVVKAYLQQHGEATYKELLETLTQAGMRINERTFQTRVKRWEKRGMVIVEKRGYPATAYVKLPVVQFAHPQSTTLQTAQTVQTAQTGDTAPTTTSPTHEVEENEHTHSLSCNTLQTGETEPTTTSLALEEVVEHTDSLSCSVPQTEQSGETDTPTTTTTDGSSLHSLRSLRSLRSLHTPRDELQTALQTDGNGEPQSPEPQQPFTSDENPATGAVYELPQPTTVADGTLSPFAHSDNPHIPQPDGLSDTLNPTVGGVEMVNRTNRNSTVDTDTLFRTALQVGFPRFTVVHNGNRLDVEGSYAGWKTALPTLAQQNVMREAYLALNRCRTRKETQPIVVKITPDGSTFSTVWRVEVVSIEWIDDGKRLRWVFRTLDDNRTLTATTKYSTEPDSKLARWITVLTREPNPPIDTLDLSQLVGKVADGVIVHKQSPDGSEQLELFNLVRVKRAE